MEENTSVDNATVPSTAPETPAEPISQPAGIPEPVAEKPIPVQAEAEVKLVKPAEPVAQALQAEAKPAEPVTQAQQVTYQPFSIPEGFDVPADGFKSVASQAGLSQAQAQAMIDYYCKEIIPARTQAIKEQINSWRQETINQMGKQGMDMMDGLVNRISKTNPLFAPLLRDTGLCYHPVVVKAFVDLASHMTEGGESVPMSTFKSPQEQRSLASILFPNSLK